VVQRRIGLRSALATAGTGIIPTAAIANAVGDALAPWVRRADEVPLTCARVLALLRAAG